MIAKISGVLSYSSIDYIMIDANGIGYKIFVPYSTYYHLPEIGFRLSLHIHMHVKDDGISLYGFLTPEEKGLFEALIGISKIGPKLATNILSGASVDELKAAIVHQDITRISSIPGIGRKTAERIVLELKDKVSPDAGKKEDFLRKDEEHDTMLSDCISALVNLGYHKKAAREAVDKIRQNLDGDAGFEEIIRNSLKVLMR
jgi:Holliday junction DNA helicase RuvA